jgi:hypothetical protein
MITSVLIVLIAMAGLIMIAGGLASFVHLLYRRTGTRIPLRYYAAAIGMICGGLGMWGVAQVLRLEPLLIILENAHR